MKKAWLVVLALTRLASADAAKSKRLYDEGMRAGNGGDLPGAVAKLKAAVAADAKNFLAEFNLGGAYEAQGDKDAAVEHYARTVALRPDFVEAQTQLGTLYLLAKHDEPRAIACYRAALLAPKPYVDPRFPLGKTQAQALLNLAVAYAGQGRLGVAHAIAESFLNSPELSHAKDANMQTLLRRTENDMAAAGGRKLGDILDGARKELYGGDPEGALRDYTAVEKTHDFSTMSDINRWDLYEGIGMASAQAKRPAAVAAQAFERARDAAAKLAHRKLIESTYNLACALAEDGRVDAALTQLEEAFWLEWVTRNAPSSADRKPLYLSAASDPSLARLRAKLPALTARYAFR